jgi:predicted MFS family arabinose efflux permease
VVAGLIVDAFDNHYLFWLPLVFIVIAAIAAQVFIPELRTRESGRISLVPATLLSAWLIAFFLAVSEGSRWGWLSWRTDGLLVLSAVLAVCWVTSENRAARPLVDMRMMRVPTVWTTNAVALLFGAGMYTISAFLPEFLQTPPSAGDGIGASVTASGVFLLPLTVTMFTFGLLSGRLADRLGSKALVITRSVLSTGAFLVLAVAHAQRWEIHVASALLGPAWVSASPQCPISSSNRRPRPRWEWLAV